MHCPDVVVTDRAVYFDGYELPWFISEDGIDFKPGGRTDFNRLRVEFIVESARFEISWETKHRQRWSDLGAKVSDEYTDELFRLLKDLHG